MDYPAHFPVALRPATLDLMANAARRPEQIVSGDREMWQRAETFIQAHPAFADAFRPGDSLQERTEIWFAMMMFRPGQALGGRTLPQRGALSATEYVAQLHVATELAFAETRGFLDGVELTEQDLPAAVVLPQLTDALGEQMAARRLGFHPDQDLGEADERRRSALAAEIEIPGRRSAENLTAYVARLHGLLDESTLSYAALLMSLHELLHWVERAYMAQSIRALLQELGSGGDHPA